MFFSWDQWESSQPAPAGYLEHRNQCQHHSLDSAYLNIFWGFFFGWVLFWGEILVFHWKKYSEILVPWWWTISPCLVFHAPSVKFLLRELTGVHQEMTFSGWGRAWLTCPSSDTCTSPTFTTLPLFTSTDCGNWCCSNVPGLSAYVQSTEQLLFQIQPWSEFVVHNFVTSTDVFSDLTLWPVSAPLLLVWRTHLLQQGRGAELLNSFQNKAHFFLCITVGGLYPKSV